MAVKKRQCGTCRFFVQSETTGRGVCSNPGWEGSKAPQLLLRPTELACRSQWGRSLWEDPNAPLDQNPARPVQPTLPEPTSIQLHFDDEVTSVSIAGSKTTRASSDDGVVDSGATSAREHLWDDDIQAERRSLLNSSAGEAIAGARKRMMDRKERNRELIPFAEDEADETPATTSAQEPDTQPESEQRFPPDDFVEDESPSFDDDIIDDELVDDGSVGSPRSPRLRHLLSPKTPKAMRLGVSAEMAVTADNPENREQWNSVPQITPGFELPLQMPAERTGDRAPRLSASAATYAATPVPSRPVSQAREFVTENRLRDQRAQRQVAIPLAEDQQPHEDVERTVRTETGNLARGYRPRLSQATTVETPTVDRLKTSPLRGYHPTPKSPSRLAPQEVDERTLRSRRVEPGQQASTAMASSADRPTSASGTRPERRDSSNQPMVVPEAPQAPSTSTQNRHSDTGDVTEPHAPAQKRRPHISLQPVHQTPFESQAIEISPRIPRACGTCASYRPGSVEGRGSCANAFAGPVQRVVHEQDLACQHTFGCFWIPADEEVWLTEMRDTSAPTPRIDAMIARRERKTVPVLPDLEELTS